MKAFFVGLVIFASETVAKREFTAFQLAVREQRSTLLNNFCSEAKSAKLRFASKMKIQDVLTQSEASRF